MPDASFRWTRALALLACGALMGSLSTALVVGWGRDEAPPPAAAADAASALAALAERLESEQRARVELVDEVATLRGELDALLAALDGAAIEEGWSALGTTEPPSPDGATAAAPLATEASDAAGGGEEPDADAPSAAGTAPWFNAQALLDAGLTQDEVDRLRGYWEEYELEKLYIQDANLRAAAQGVPRNRHERLELDRQVREDLGDDDYDRLLYASGQPNRVVASEVLGASPGAEAGLQPGDVILRYDGQRIFRPRDLVIATSSAKVGASVPVVVLRNQRELRLWIPAGPIGTKLLPIVEAP